MPKYIVSVKIYNSFEIEADSEEQAEQAARELDAYQTLVRHFYYDEKLEEVNEDEG